MNVVVVTASQKYFHFNHLLNQILTNLGVMMLGYYVSLPRSTILSEWRSSSSVIHEVHTNILLCLISCIGLLLFLDELYALF